MWRGVDERSTLALDNFGLAQVAEIDGRPARRGRLDRLRFRPLRPGRNLLLNEGSHGNALLVQAVGSTSNRSAIGTKLTLTAGGQRQVREIQSGSSYLAQNDPRAHFGLGRAARAERLEIRWPDGSNEVVENLLANQLVVVRQGNGIVSRTPLAR